MHFLPNFGSFGGYYNTEITIEMSSYVAYSSRWKRVLEILKTTPKRQFWENFSILEILVANIVQF